MSEWVSYVWVGRHCIVHFPEKARWGLYKHIYNVVKCNCFDQSKRLDIVECKKITLKEDNF